MSVRAQSGTAGASRGCLEVTVAGAVRVSLDVTVRAADHAAPPPVEATEVLVTVVVTSEPPLGPVPETLTAAVPETVTIVVPEDVPEAVRPPGRGSRPLTGRELDILRLTAQALSNAQIASRLRITEATVKRHLTNIYGKLQAVSRLDAVRKASAARLIGMEHAEPSDVPASL